MLSSSCIDNWLTTIPKIKRCLLFGRKVMTILDSILKSRNITLSTKVHLVKAIVFPVVHVWMWELDYKENWASKNWCFWTVVLEKTLESPLDCKEIQPVHPKGNQPEYSLEGHNKKEEWHILPLAQFSENQDLKDYCAIRATI